MNPLTSGGGIAALFGWSASQPSVRKVAMRAERGAEWRLVLEVRGRRDLATARVLVNATGPWLKLFAEHAAGVCPDLQGFAAEWRCARRFEPQMDAATRERKWTGWRDAVARTLR